MSRKRVAVKEVSAVGYSNLSINRKQAQQVCFAIIADIENFCEEHKEEYEEFLKNEEKSTQLEAIKKEMTQ